jgi:hypothetical protein
MRRRCLIGVSLALLSSGAQAPLSLTGQWAGDMDMTIHAPSTQRGSMPTALELQQDGTRLKGRWRALPPNTSTGSLEGTVAADGTVTATIVFYTDADLPKGGIAPERCEGRGTFKGELGDGTILRLTADSVRADQRPRRKCGRWPTDLVWTLKRDAKDQTDEQTGADPEAKPSR